MLTAVNSSFQAISTGHTSWGTGSWAGTALLIHDGNDSYVSPWWQPCLATGDLLPETDEERRGSRWKISRPWTVGRGAGRFREVARRLGIFNGEYLAGRPLPTDPWLSRGWLRGWTEEAKPLIDLVPTVSSHPVAGKIFTKDLIKDLIELWEQRERLYQALDRLPGLSVTTMSSPASLRWWPESP